jgi:uncharacterized protein (TIGR03066 family)
MKLLRWTLVGCLAIGLAGCAGPTSSTGGKPPTTPPKPGEPKKEGASGEPKKEGVSGEPKKEGVNKEKLVGTWEVTKSKGAPPGATVEFTKDGKMKMTFKEKGKEQSMEAMYSVDGNKITSTIKRPDGKEEKDTATIEKLTDTELVIKDKKGDIDEYKKKK